MQREGVKPNDITFINVLGACANVGALEQGKQIHSQIVNSGIKPDVVLENALINMFGKCGSLEDARTVFDEMHQRNVISWNAMIGSYAQHGFGKEALDLFHQMQQQGVKPDDITFISVLGACANVAALEQGKQIHSQIINSGIKPDVVLGKCPHQHAWEVWEFGRCSHCVR